jgi:hypothetical protein
MFPPFSLLFPFRALMAIILQTTYSYNYLKLIEDMRTLRSDDPHRTLSLSLSVSVCLSFYFLVGDNNKKKKKKFDIISLGILTAHKISNWSRSEFREKRD